MRKSDHRWVRIGTDLGLVTAVCAIALSLLLRLDSGASGRQVTEPVAGLTIMPVPVATSGREPVVGEKSDAVTPAVAGEEVTSSSENAITVESRNSSGNSIPEAIAYIELADGLSFRRLGVVSEVKGLLLSPGSLQSGTLVVRAAGYVEARIEKPLERVVDRRIVIEMKSAVAIRGLVTRANGTALGQKCTVAIARATDLPKVEILELAGRLSDGPLAKIVTTDSVGRFEYTEAESGVEYRITVSAPGFVSTSQAGVRCVPPANDLRVSMDELFWLRLRVESDDGGPLLLDESEVGAVSTSIAFAHKDWEVVGSDPSHSAEGQSGVPRSGLDQNGHYIVIWWFKQLSAAGRSGVFHFSTRHHERISARVVPRRVDGRQEEVILRSRKLSSSDTGDVRVRFDLGKQLPEMGPTSRATSIGISSNLTVELVPLASSPEGRATKRSIRLLGEPVHFKQVSAGLYRARVVSCGEEVECAVTPDVVVVQADSVAEVAVVPEIGSILSVRVADIEGLEYVGPITIALEWQSESTVARGPDGRAASIRYEFQFLRAPYSVPFVPVKGMTVLAASSGYGESEGRFVLVRSGELAECNLKLDRKVSRK